MRDRFTRLARIGLLLAVLASQSAPRARAQGALDGPDAAEGPKRVARFTACASALALATSYSQAYLAIVVCLRIITEELPAN